MKKNEAKRWIAPMAVVLAFLLTVGGLVAYGAGVFDGGSPSIDRPAAPPVVPATTPAPRSARSTPGVCPVTGMTADDFPKGSAIPAAPAATAAPGGCCPEDAGAGETMDCDHEASSAAECEHDE